MAIIRRGKKEAAIPAAAARKKKVSAAERRIQAAAANPWSVIHWSKLTEKAIAQVERGNKLVFVVKSGATKAQVKRAVEKAFEVRVENVNMMIDPRGQKKAFVRLKPEFNALDIATRLGMM